MCYTSDESSKNTRGCVFSVILQQSPTVFCISYTESLVNVQHSSHRAGCQLGSSIFLYLFHSHMKRATPFKESKDNKLLMNFKLNNSLPIFIL